MTDLLIWGGPVMASNLAGVALPDSVHVETFNRGPDGGFGSSSFSLLAQSMQGPDGRILPSLLASRGLSREQFGKVAIAGFSAFHGLASPLLAADGDQIDAAFLLDSCFSGVSPPWEKAGYVAFAAEAARGRKAMVFTSSAGGGPGGQYPSSTGSQCAVANAQAGAAAAGVSLDAYDPPASMPPMSQGAGYRAGNLIVLDYAGQFLHGDHVNRFGADTLNTYLVPFYAGSFGGSVFGDAAGPLLFVGAAVAAYALVRYLQDPRAGGRLLAA